MTGVPEGGHRVLAPEVDPDVPVKGPASYFASIEKTYGHPIQAWLDVAAEGLAEGRTHMQVVDHLTSDHGMGHGHANAVVAYVKATLS